MGGIWRSVLAASHPAASGVEMVGLLTGPEGHLTVSPMRRRDAYAAVGKVGTPHLPPIEYE
jgi:hypothetical protein